MPQPKEEFVTIDYIYSLPDGERAELIDGIVYNMSPPNTLHQKIVMQISHQITSAIEKNYGECEVFPAPFAVFLNNDEYTYVEPDISLICDTKKIGEKGCNGAPELVVEVVSPSSKKMDYFIKLNKYINSGVFEYIIVDPIEKQIFVYNKNNDYIPKSYKLTDEIKVGIIKDCTIKLKI